MVIGVQDVFTNVVVMSKIATYRKTAMFSLASAHVSKVSMDAHVIKVSVIVFLSIPVNKSIILIK